MADIHIRVMVSTFMFKKNEPSSHDKLRPRQPGHQDATVCHVPNDIKIYKQKHHNHQRYPLLRNVVR